VAAAQLGHVLVDEYQDTNATQYEVLKLLVGERGRFTAVGDDDQSIYGWRGATLDNLKKLPHRLPQLKVIKLEQNYRSTSAILRAANNVIGPNPKLFPKTLFSELGEGEPVRVVDADNEEHEAERTVARIQSIRAGQWPMPPLAWQPGWKDFAVLYRANHQARMFEQALRKANIPYKVSGGQSFFDRAEIKDLCAWFRLWVNNDDDPAFLRAITTPKRGIGHTTLQNLGVFASKYKLSLFEALFSSSLGSCCRQGGGQPARVWPLCERPGVPRPPHHGAEDARPSCWTGSRTSATKSTCTTARTARSWPPAAGPMCWTFATGCPALRRHHRRHGGREPGKRKEEPAGGGADHCPAVHHQRTRDRPGRGDLSTLHAAKGLEWPHVMLVGVTEGMLPFKLGDDDNPTGRADGPMSEGILQRLQEERRLMYVGITRAQRSLAVSWTKRRKKGREMVAAQPSRFIAEMALDKTTVKEDPREKLKALRAEFAKKADIEAGELLLDESVDGRTISAVWAGQVVAGRCGKEIRGSWRRASDDTVRGFTLTKLPGWD
jgi:ATP-dependent DNA helicase Rep